MAHALGHTTCRRGHSVLAVRADQMLKTLKHARLDNSYEAELRKLIAVDLLLPDDFALDAMNTTGSRDAYEIFTERHRAGSMIVTSNRGPDEWLATFADPVRAQSAIDRFTSNSYDLPSSTVSRIVATSNQPSARCGSGACGRHGWYEGRAAARATGRLGRGCSVSEIAQLRTRSHATTGAPRSTSGVPTRAVAILTHFC